MQPTQTPRLARLARFNPTTVFLATLALVLVALFAPGPVGGVLLLLLAAGLVWLMSLTWAVQRPATRVLRLVMLTLLIAVALTKLV
jgi:energy-coupling factor transporter transmembrane protein EcfT